MKRRPGGGSALARIALLVLVFSLALLTMNLIRVDGLALGRSADRSLLRARELAARAGEFDADRALKELGSSRINGHFYRFDDHLDEAMVETGGVAADSSPNGLPAHESLYPLSLEFDGSDPIPFGPVSGPSSLIEGRLVVPAIADTLRLKTRRPLDIDPREIAEIHIRIRLERGRTMMLSWWHDGGVANRLTVHASPPDGEFHTYHIDAESFMRIAHTQEHSPSGSKLRGIMLEPSTISGDRVEIDFIRLVSRRAKYAQRHADVTHVSLGPETRRSIYVNTPTTLRYQLTLPEAGATLQFGVGALDSQPPAHLRVELRSGDRRQVIFSQEIQNTSSWQDVSIDLPDPFSGNGEIEFRISGERNTIFLSNPILRAQKRERLNILLILEDTLRADRLSAYGYQRDTSPATDRFFSEGVVFLNGFSQATKTRPSCPSMVTSLYPTATGVWNFNEMLDDRYLTLAEVLRSQGFSTAGFVQNPNAGIGAGLHQGFGTYVGREDLGRRAEGLYGEELDRWLGANQDENFFLYLHLVDPHGPYDPSPEHRKWQEETRDLGPKLARSEVFDPEWVDEVGVAERRARYDGEIAQNDAYFGAFVEKLEALDLLDDTLVIFVSDHGEHQGEHGLWEHHPPGYIQGIHVPIMMRFPGRLPARRRVEEPVQLIDVMPTILELAGIPSDPLMMQGDSLVSLARSEDMEFWRSRVAISDEVMDRSRKNDGMAWGSVFFGKYHMINSARFPANRLTGTERPRFTRLKVYDYVSDAAEEESLWSFAIDPIFMYWIGSYMSELQHLNTEIWRGLARDSISAGVSQSIHYDPDEIARLRELGYVE